MLRCVGQWQFTNYIIQVYDSYDIKLAIGLYPLRFQTTTLESGLKKNRALSYKIIY